MNKIIILYWQPGSGGDLIQSLLLDSEYSGVVDDFTITEAGRLTPAINLFFADTFKSDPNQWYLREWNEQDCNKLHELLIQYKINKFVIPTHRYDQVVFLKKQFGNSISVGITYPKNMFPVVLKNWCKKVAVNDANINKIYNQPQHVYLKNNNIFGEFILTEQLKFGTNIETKVNEIFDINISLEKLLAGNITDINLLIDNVDKVIIKYRKWLENQNTIQKYRYSAHPLLLKALGFNNQANKLNTCDLELDRFDNVLIKQYINTHTEIKNIPWFNTLTEADIFLTTEELNDN